MDFEKSAENAFRIFFSQSIIHGCWFHYTQCIYRYIQSLGLSELYQNNPQFHKFIKCFMALLFAKIEDIFKYYEDLLAYSEGKT